jgi:Raf kinase inhibitor-like YbhB/YbcL family protein
MKKNFVIIASLLILGILIFAGYYFLGRSFKKQIVSNETTTDQDAKIIGGDKDEHGCLIGAGYTWCDTKQKCIRPWEEECASGQITSNMNIISSAFETNQKIPSRYTCDGANISPPFAWKEIPEGTKSLALIVDDPDAPAGDWVHWLIWNIDPVVSSVNESTIPSNATVGSNSFGDIGYGGPCPPSGTHRYQFKLYALDTMLDLSEGAKKADLEQAMQGRILDESVLVGLYR